MNPCGDAPGVDDEILLRLSSGVVLASAPAGGATFVVLTPGVRYATRDRDACSFTITPAGHLADERR